jgi:serine/threonine protein phosphatase PrpC
VETARDLVDFANGEGGQDNITAVILSYPPAVLADQYVLEDQSRE